MWGLIMMLCWACSSGAEERARQGIETQDKPRVEALIAADLASHQAAVAAAAEKLRPGFAVQDPVRREREMRAALRIVQDPKKGIEAFVASPMSFLAAVDEQGVVVARDREPDRMKGQDFKARFDVVGEALRGDAAMGLGEFYAKDPNMPSSWSILFAAPAAEGGQVRGAVIAGIPLWRMAQRLSRQLRLEHAAQIEQGLGVWVYVYKGNRVFHWDTPPEVDAVIPAPEIWAEGLQRSPEGFTGTARVMGEPYVYGIYPMPSLGPDVGTIIFRTES